MSAFKVKEAADGGGNVLLTGATMQGKGLVIVYGQNDVITQEGREKHESLTEMEKHESSWLGFVETTTTTHDEVNQDLAVKNQITGGAAWIKGERDLTLRGADVAAAGDVQLTAGRDLTITAAEDRVYESHEKKVVTSGFLTSGVGIMVGTRTRTDQAGVETTANVGSVVGSVGGTVTIEAGGDARIQGSDVLSKVGTSITGENVTIEALTEFGPVFNRGGSLRGRRRGGRRRSAHCGARPHDHRGPGPHLRVAREAGPGPWMATIT